ncbi:hypothetical protein BY996DRAFT_4589314 [Phakopsora pachyrhizi]|nr:hypothetical protein BY996DRAFT_4589314 [Phakopsora pachyrhizi]
MSRPVPLAHLPIHQYERIDIADADAGAPTDRVFSTSHQVESDVATRQISSSPKVLLSPPLSPLVQRSPSGIQEPLLTSSLGRKSDRNLYDGFSSEDQILQLEANLKFRQSQAGNFLSAFRHEREKWLDPGESISLRTLFTVLIAGLGILGLFVIMGKASTEIDRVDQRIASSDISSKEISGVISDLFPFSPDHYYSQCLIPEEGAYEIGETASEKSDFGRTNRSMIGSTEIYIHSPYFSSTAEERDEEKNVFYSSVDQNGDKICEKTLTYLLDDDYGFAFHLNAITMAAALAKSDSRSFFISDSQWDRGTWGKYFKPSTEVKCRPPPPDEMRGCPRTTKHWIITSAILAYHFSPQEFGVAFGNEDASDEVLEEDVKGIIPYQRQPIFEMARKSFFELFILNDLIREIIYQTKQEIIDSNIWGSKKNNKLSPYISVHIRKGDRHPFDPSHKLDYLPVTDYVDAINSTWNILRQSDSTLPDSPNVYLASDTPLILDVIKAASPRKWRYFHLSQARSKNLSTIAHPHEYSQMHFHAHVLSEREDYTRGQIVDMAFLGGGWPLDNGKVALTSKDLEKPLSTICTVSSNICQFAALQLGWEDAFEHLMWINLDLPLEKKWEGVSLIYYIYNFNW